MRVRSVAIAFALSLVPCGVCAESGRDAPQDTPPFDTGPGMDSPLPDVPAPDVPAPDVPTIDTGASSMDSAVAADAGMDAGTAAASSGCNATPGARGRWALLPLLAVLGLPRRRAR